MKGREKKGSGKPSFICEKCKREFSNRASLKVHMKAYEGKLPFACDYCDQRCASNIMAHVLTHSDERPFSCITCNRQMRLRWQLIRHIQIVHRKPKRDANQQANDASLDYLKKVTKNPNYDGPISSRVVLSHAVNKVNFRILTGPDRTSSAQATSSGRSRVPKHSNRLDRITILGGHPFAYQCNVCGNEIKKKDHLRHHGNNCNKNGHKCLKCGKQFSSMSALLIHKRTHTGEKPHKCPTCDKRFTVICSLNVHIRSHTAETPFICKKCKRNFRNRVDLNRHVLEHEGKPPLCCSHCDRRFATMTKLKEHVIIHCGKTDSFNMFCHIPVLLYERPYTCPNCEGSFPRKQELVRHIQRLHHQPREDAMRLANEAGVDYLGKENQVFIDTISYSRIESVVLSHVIKKAKLKL